MKLKSTINNNINLHPANVNETSSTLTALDNKIDQAKRDISFWDLYGIYGSFTGSTSEELQTVLLSLPLNKSLVINTSTPIYSNGTTYYRGDIFYRLYDGSIHVVQSNSGGVYIPTQIAKGHVKYSYSVTPENEAEIEIETTASEYMYSENGTLDSNSIEFGVIKINDTIEVYPVVKFTYNNEQIFLDYSLSLSETDSSKYILRVTNFPTNTHYTVR